MKPDALRLTLSATAPPAGLSILVQALWHDAKGDWHRAHEMVQSVKGKAGAKVHAYLHRKEGDSDNANYWYDRAGMKAPKITLEAEWNALVMALLRGQSKRRGPRVGTR